MLIRCGYVYFYCIPPFLRRFYFLSKNLENYGLKCQKIAGHVKDISVFFGKSPRPLLELRASGPRIVLSCLRRPMTLRWGLRPPPFPHMSNIQGQERYTGAPSRHSAPYFFRHKSVPRVKKKPSVTMPCTSNSKSVKVSL